METILSPAAVAAIEQACTRYPSRMAALLPALHIVQAELGCISPAAQLEIAALLDVPPTRVREVVTFYTMFHDAAKGRHVVKICRNLACQLRGANKLIKLAQQTLGVALGETTADGRVTLETEECLASCGTAPMLWCNDTYVENLNEEKLVAFLNGLL